MSPIYPKVVIMTTEQSAAITAKIAGRLRASAYDRHISQGKLAEAAGLSRSAVNEHLNGRRPIPMPVFLDYCRALGLDAVAVLQDAQDAASK